LNIAQNSDTITVALYIAIQQPKELEP